MLDVYRQSGIWDDRLDSVDVPEEGEFLWGVFWELRRGEDVTLAEIEAWGRLNGTTLSPWEVGTIRAMDARLSAFIAEKIKHG